MFETHFSLGGHKVACMRSWSQRTWDIDSKWKREGYSSTTPTTTHQPKQEQRRQKIAKEEESEEEEEEKHYVVPLTDADDFECVEQFSAEGELLAKYEDLDTAETYTNTWKRDIMRCMRGKIDQAGTFIWRD